MQKNIGDHPGCLSKNAQCSKTHNKRECVCPEIGVINFTTPTPTDAVCLPGRSALSKAAALPSHHAGPAVAPFPALHAPHAIPDPLRAALGHPAGWSHPPQGAAGQCIPRAGHVTLPQCHPGTAGRQAGRRREPEGGDTGTRRLAVRGPLPAA